MKDPLFEPIKINQLELKNRIYLPAMHMNMARDFEVTDQLIDFYAERARGGVGIITVGYATVDELSGNSTNIGAHKDEFIPGLQRLAQAIQSNGARAAVQINHAGRYNFFFFLDGKQAVAMIADGLCNMVAMGRPLIADPYLPEKARTGREVEIVHCIACAQGCFDNLFKLKPVECLCNPKAGHESEIAVEKTTTPKKIMVVGGGAAGMSAVLAAREKGHEVTLYEKGDRLGGQLYLAAAPRVGRNLPNWPKTWRIRSRLAQ